MIWVDMCFPWRVSTYCFQYISMAPVEFCVFMNLFTMKACKKNGSPILAPNSYNSLTPHVFLSYRKGKDRLNLFDLLEVKSRRMCNRKVSGQRLHHLKYVIGDISPPAVAASSSKYSVTFTSNKAELEAVLIIYIDKYEGLNNNIHGALTLFQTLHQHFCKYYPISHPTPPQKLCHF